MASGHDHVREAATKEGQLKVALGLTTTYLILLEGVPPGIELQALHDELAALPGVQEVHDLHVWAITSGQNSLTTHLVVKGDQANLSLIEEAQQIAREHGIEHASIQLEEPGLVEEEHRIHPGPESQSPAGS